MSFRGKILVMSTTEKQFKKFKKLPEEFKNDVMGRKNPEELYKLIRESAINNVELGLARDQDEDLARIKEQKTVAEQVYTEGMKANSLKIEFIVECLKSQGIPIPGFTKKQIMAEAQSKTVGDAHISELEKAAADTKVVVQNLVDQLKEMGGEITFNGDAFRE